MQLKVVKHVGHLAKLSGYGARELVVVNRHIPRQFGHFPYLRGERPLDCVGVKLEVLGHLGEPADLRRYDSRERVRHEPHVASETLHVADLSRKRPRQRV